MHTNKRRILPALLASLFLGAAAPAVEAQQFSNVIVFGDSLSDVGYFRPVLTAAGVPPALVSVLGRFTTSPGPIWAERIASYYGVNLQPSNVTGGTDFAQGGARVASNSASTPPGAAQRPVTTQVGEYLTRVNNAADPNALYTMWAGANDVLQILAGASSGQIPADQVSGLVQAAAAAEIQQIARLRGAGARNIVVFGLPNIGQTPGLIAAGPVASATATQLSSGFNTALFAGLAGAGIRVIPIDSFTFLSEIRANPGIYGITNITTPACGAFPPFSSGPDAFYCPPQAWTSANANETNLFADGIHPTTAGHRLIAQFMEAAITGPFQYSMLAETQVSARTAYIRALAEGVVTGHRDEVGKWSVFVTGNRSDFDIDAAMGNPSVDSRSDYLSIGATARVSEAVTMGLAIGRNKLKANMGGNGGQFVSPGGFKSNEDVYSIFGMMRLGGFYGGGILSIGDISYNHIQRNVILGNAVRTSNTTANGSNTSAGFNVGYDFKLGPVYVAPTASVVYQDVTVDGFDENGMASANLRLSEQRRKSEVWSAGVRVSATFGAWTPWVRVTADKERRDDVRYITAAPISIIDGALKYDVPAYQPDNTFMTTWLGVRGSFERWSVAISYYNVSGRSGIKEDGIAGMVSLRF